MALPEFVQIEPVGQCNLRCQMCPIQFRRDGPPHGPVAFMDFTVFQRLIDELSGVKELHLQGLGEPLMHPRFFDMVAYAVSKGVRVSTNSNMTLVTRTRAEKLIRSGLDTLHVSVDGATAETYERIRVQARFERVKRNIALVQETKARLGSSTPRLRLICVIMRQNLEELPDIVAQAAAWDIEEMFVQHLCHDFQEETLPAHYHPMRSFVHEQSLLEEDAADIASWFAKAKEVALERGIDLRLPRTRPRPHPPGTPGPKRCDWPWKGPYISYQGLAMPCCMVATPDRINLGDVTQNGVLSVWQSEAYERFRADLASDEPPGVCQSCSLYRGVF